MALTNKDAACVAGIVLLIENNLAAHMQIRYAARCYAAQRDRGRALRISARPRSYVMGITGIIIVAVDDANVRSETVASVSSAENDERLSRSGPAKSNVTPIVENDFTG